MTGPQATEELLKLLRFEILDKRNSGRVACDLLMGRAATEIERLEFIQRDFHNVDDVAEIAKLKARVKWLEEWKDACEDTIARLNRKALHPDVGGAGG